MEEVLASFRADVKVLRTYWFEWGMVLAGRVTFRDVRETGPSNQDSNAGIRTAVDVLVAVHFPELEVQMDRMRTITTAGNTAIVNYMMSRAKGKDSAAFARLTKAIKLLGLLEDQFADAGRSRLALLRPKPLRERLPRRRRDSE